jgi:ubiquinone/menaquinone biosynthesis C-methylase UbiE
MELQEAIALIQTDDFIQNKPTIWADLGCGTGLFTRALATMLHKGSTISAVDKNLSSFRKSSFTKDVVITTLESDFVKDDLNLRNLDGILMANALHFVRNKKSFIEKLNLCFRGNPVFLIVEYDTDIPNPWVPHPLSFITLKNLFTEMGFAVVRKINEKQSRYRSGQLYSVIITR